MSNIKSIQRRAARFICGIYGGLRPYYQECNINDQGHRIGWSSLQSCRMVHDLALFYKSIRGQLSSRPPPSPPPPKLIITEHRIRASKEHHRTFIHPCTSVDSYKYCFFRTNNCLPPTVVNFPFPFWKKLNKIKGNMHLLSLNCISCTH